MKVLFVCTGNTCRSPMAEAIYNHLCEQNKLPNNAVSRGTNVFMPHCINPKSVCALEKFGIYKFEHTAKQLTKDDVEECDLVITMTSAQKMSIRSAIPKYKDKVITLHDKAYGRESDIDDPFGGTQDDYDHCAQEIMDALSKILCLQ